jgi:nicotinate-nucleotide adenylyltransferase
VLAQEGYWQLGLDRVVLMPAGRAPHKEIDQDPGPEERYLMCDLASWGAEWLAASRAEIDRPGPSYTVDTLRELRRERPGDEIVLLLGADRAQSFRQWREPEEILSHAALAVTRRTGVGEEAVRAALAGLPGAERTRFFDMPAIEISSTVVRERAAARRPYRFFVPGRVADRIEELDLYREGGA